MEKMKGTTVPLQSYGRRLKHWGCVLALSTCFVARGIAGTDIETKQDTKAVTPMAHGS